MIAFDEVITDELKFEGLARELINRVQRFRKECELSVDDRITLHVDPNHELIAMFKTYQALIEQETLSSLKHETPASHIKVTEEDLDGSKIRFGIQKIS